MNNSGDVENKIREKSDSVITLLQESYPKNGTDNPYISHAQFMQTLVKAHFETREKVLKDEKNKIDQELAQLTRKLEQLQQKAEENVGDVTTSTSPVPQAVPLEQRIEALEQKQKEQDKKISELNKELLNLNIQSTTHAKQLQALHEDNEKLKVGVTPRTALDAAEHDLYTKLWRMQTYSIIEVVILFGMAVPAFVLSITMFAIEASLGDIAFEKPGVELGLVLGLFVSIFMMGIAALLRVSLRKQWREEIQPSFEQYKEKLNDFLEKKLQLKQTEEEKKALAALIAANVNNAGENWLPSATVDEHNKTGFRTDALHGDVNNSEVLERHNEWKNPWIALLMFESIGGVIGGIWLSAEVHEQKSRIPHKPDWPDWTSPDTPQAASASTSGHSGHSHEFMSAEWAIIAIASIALIATVSALIYAVKQRQNGPGTVLRLGSAAGSTPSSPSAQSTRRQLNLQ